MHYHKPQKYTTMQLNTYEQLADCQQRIYNALWSDRRSDKENALNFACLNIPNLKNELDNKWENWSRQAPGRSYGPVFLLQQMDDFSIDLNLRFSNEVISERMRMDFHSPIASNAMQLLFFFPEPLRQDTVLYEEKNEDGEEKQLKFSDFLSVLSYADKFVRANCGGDKDKYNNSLMALKTVDLAINHKPVDKPLNKALHLVNDILTECAKAFHQDKEAKRTASGISLLVDLAIDFLVRS